MGISVLPLAGFELIAGDPPWQFDNYSAKGEGKSAKRHYPTMPLAAICYLLRDLLQWCCASDCVLVLFGTSPTFARGDTIKAMEAAGFTPKTMGIWRKKTKNGKRQFGTGYVFRDEMEPFLLGTRGEPKRRNKSTRNVIDAKIGRHSEKPEAWFKMLEKLYSGNKLELFARKPRPGWDAWSHEYEAFGETDQEALAIPLALRPGRYYPAIPVATRSRGKRSHRKTARLRQAKAKNHPATRKHDAARAASPGDQG